MWAQSMLASACSALCVCLPAAILIFSGLRSSVQDAFDNPWFPLMQTDEYWLPAVLSLEYATVMLLMHYSWLRANQSCSDSSAGWMLMCLGLCFLLWGFGLADSHSYHPSFLTYVPRLLTPAVVLLLVAGFRLHRSLEIRS